MVEEWIAFTVENTKPEYTYVWEYGGNKNPQDTVTFNYMYQTVGTYTMYVTVLDADGKAIGKGACTVEVVDMPTPTPEATPDVTPEPVQDQSATSGNFENFVGDWYASGTAFSIGDTSNANTMTSETSGAYLTIYNDSSYEMIFRQFTSDGNIVNAQLSITMLPMIV